MSNDTAGVLLASHWTGMLDSMQRFRIVTILGAALFVPALVWPQTYTAATLPTNTLISEPGPSFVIPQAELPAAVTLIAYGDQRFTDPANTRVTDPRVRAWVAKQIAAERPAAVVLNGDVPYSGDVANDYAVFRTESKPWRDAGLHVFPALGNHEFHGDPRQALENWWAAFPELRNRRWYSARMGERVYVIALDSDTSLLPGSDQAKWLEGQIDGLPAAIDFVVLTLHHPPVADIQTHIEIDRKRPVNTVLLRVVDCADADSSADRSKRRSRSQ